MMMDEEACVKQVRRLLGADESAPHAFLIVIITRDLTGRIFNVTKKSTQ